MSRNRFVTSATERFDLADGDWVEIKRELSVGERKKLEGSPLNRVYPGENAAKNSADVEMGIDWGRYFMTKLQVYIVAWSFRDEQGNPVKVTPDAIANLDEDTADEIDQLLTIHEAKLADQKKGRSIGTRPEVISSS
jgi:hypothetical protein